MSKLIRCSLLLMGAVLLFIPHLASAQSVADPVPGERPRNVILFISDGSGPASFTMARDYLRYKGEEAALALDRHQVGSIHTFAADSRVTDSAAGATAFSAGVKTYNGAIAVDTLQRPVATILEAAERRGMATGLVATSRITHATPAAFSAHVPERGEEATIAAQQLRQGIDVLLGGGRGWFLPSAQDGWRDDERNLLEEAAAEGYTVVHTRDAFDAVATTPVLGLFTDSHMAYEIDRDALDEPSLAEMTRKAIDLLDDDPDGYFLMVEGSRIDHAGHDNDAAGHLHDVLAYDAAIRAALGAAGEETLILSTSDHETGGLTLGARVEGQSLYTWKPEVLDRVQASQRVILGEIHRRLSETQAGVPADSAAVTTEVVGDLAGITLDDDEAARLVAAMHEDWQAAAVLADVIARRAVVGWTTGGHTAVDVNLYAYGPGRDAFVGHFDNTYVGAALADLLGLDLEALTEQLRQTTVGSN